MKRLSTLIISLTFGLQAFAQTGYEYLYKAEVSIESFTDKAANGDILFAVDSYNDTAAFFHRLIVQRLDIQGSIKQTASVFRPPSFRMIGGIKATSDNGVLLMGTVNIPLEDADSVFVTKLNDMGQISWSKGFQVEPNIHVPHGAIETGDGSYLVYGTYEHVNFAEGIFLIKISSTGSLVWSRTINSQLNGAFMKVGGIVEAANGDFWLSGSTRFNSEGSWLAKLNNLGETQSVLFLNTHKLTPSQPEPFALHQRSNGELDIFYNSLGFQTGPVLLAIRTDVNGIPQKATRFYRGADFGEITAIHPDGGDDYVGAGYYFPGSGVRSNGVALKINNDYTTGWTRKYGESYIEITTGIFPSSDGGHVLSGFADFDSVIISPSENGLFPWLIKTDDRGQTSCYDNGISFSTRDTIVTTMGYQLSNVPGVSLGDIAFQNINVSMNPDTVSCVLTSIVPLSLEHFVMYPNPSQGDIYIDTEGKFVTSAEAYNLFGKRLNASVVSIANQIRIKTDYKGMAIIRLQTAAGMWSEKVVFE